MDDLDELNWKSDTELPIYNYNTDLTGDSLGNVSYNKTNPTCWKFNLIELLIFHCEESFVESVATRHSSELCHRIFSCELSLNIYSKCLFGDF